MDADYRSDFASFWSTRFDVPSPFTRRVHFFRADLKEEQLPRLPARARASYLGYSVLRPGPHQDGRVGRTVLAPPPRLQQATLTTIEDQVSFFGNRLKVVGVPWLEQDGEFLRCAHAAIWGCHYSAYKRGLVGRRLTAELVDVTPNVLSADRALPSRGMLLEQIQAVFAASGQPALRYVLGHLPNVPGVELPIPTSNSAGLPHPPGYWDIRLFSVICRYLNSGFPVMVTSSTHGWNLVGWFSSNGNIKFVASDDQVGPYEVIDSPFSDSRRAPWRSIMVPLPPKVYMSGEIAENWAHQNLRSFGLKAGASPSWRALAEALAATPKGVSLRTFLRDSTVYKETLLDQNRPASVVDTLRMARLPHYVWVVEAHDRTLREEGKPSVLAEVLFDPHSSDHVHRRPRMDSISLPGLTVVMPPEGGAPVPIEPPEKVWRSQLLHP